MRRRETVRFNLRLPIMNISRIEQRVLHVLALGGEIRIERDDRGKLCGIMCLTRDGLFLADCTTDLFRRLRRRRFIASRGGSPYRISREGRLAVRAQPDNQG